MSIFRVSDYTQKNQKNVMVKTRLPTESKTKKHKCSQCTRMDASWYQIRWLCPVHRKKYDNQFKKEFNCKFIKAGELYDFQV